MRSQSFGLVTFATFCVSQSIGFAFGADYRQELLFVLTGMKKERSALKTGICYMRGKSVFKSSNNDYEDMNGELIIFSAFDDRGQIRFDHTQPGWVPDPATAKEDPKHPGVIASLGMKKGIVSQKYYKNIKRAGHWNVGSPVIDISADDKKIPLNQVNYFDVKALGLYYWIALHRGLTVDEMLAGYEQMKSLSAVDKSDPSIWSITWSHTDDVATTEWKMWLDVKHGFTPVRYENRARLLGQDSWCMIQTYQTKWAKMSDVWVPIRHEMMKTPMQGKWRQDITFDIEWESINKPINEDVFDYKGFGAPEDVSVVDITFSQPVTIKSSITPPPPKTVNHGANNRRYFHMILFLISSTVLIVAILYFVLKRRKGTTNASHTGGQQQ